MHEPSNKFSEIPSFHLRSKLNSFCVSLDSKSLFNSQTTLHTSKLPCTSVYIFPSLHCPDEQFTSMQANDLYFNVVCFIQATELKNISKFHSILTNKNNFNCTVTSTFGLNISKGGRLTLESGEVERYSYLSHGRHLYIMSKVSGNQYMNDANLTHARI